MTSINKIPAIRDIYSDFRLTDFDRKWHNKRTKLSRQFWSLVLHTIYLPAENPVPPDVISNLYMNLFYRPTEIHQSIIAHYDRYSTNLLKTNVDFSTEKNHFIKKNFTAYDELLKELQNVKFKSRSQSTLHEIDINEFDSQHPHLERVSDCFKQVINYGGFRHLYSMVYTLSFDLRPTVCRNLNRLADSLILPELFFNALYRLESSLDYMTVYNSRIIVEGVTEALRDAMNTHPNILQFPDQRIRYEISQKYSLINGSFEYLQKAINRERKRFDEKETKS